MALTTTFTSKGQITIPKAIREKHKYKIGQKVDIYPTSDGGFIAKPHRQSKIMDFAGDLARLDKGETLSEIRAKLIR